MKPSDIKVGARYKHKDFSQTVYMGVGNRLEHGGFTHKALVIIEDKEEPDMVGVKVGSYRHRENFWAKFVPEEKVYEKGM